MNLSSLAKLPLTADEGWPDLARLYPTVGRTFLLLVLPLSLLPPAMLYYAGTHYPEVLGAGALAKNWAQAAAAFFAMEWATYLMMGGLIRRVSGSHGLRIDAQEAYLLAATAAVPLWLSSLGLLVPSLAFNATVSTMALALSCAVLYQGLQALGRTREQLVAAGIVQIVIGAGLIAWALLLVLALL